MTTTLHGLRRPLLYGVVSMALLTIVSACASTPDPTPASGEARAAESTVGLENLNLERVALANNKATNRQEWFVSGTVTEFRGVNYLLIEKAVLKEQVEVATASH